MRRGPALALAAAAAALVLGTGLATPVRAAAATGASPVPAAPPALHATAAALLDADTGQLLYGHNAQRPLAIASTTKLMTALITLERVPLSAVFADPNFYFAPGDSQIALIPGERMTVHDLLLALLLPSADDAAADLAYNIGGHSIARFLTLMNARAAQLGLTRTHYTTPSGLDTPGNYSTAADLVKLARYVMRTQPFFRRAVALTHARLRSGDHPRLIVNRNDLVGRFSWINGIKTGHTLRAGYVLVGSGTRNGMTLISVVLGTSSEAERDAATLALLRWGFANFVRRTVIAAGAAVSRVPVRYRPHNPARVLAGASFTRVLARRAVVRTRALLPRQVAGPLPRGARVGTLLILSGGRVIGRVPLVLAARLAAASPGVSLASLAAPITLVSAVLLALIAAVAGGFGRKRTRGRAAEGPKRQ
ncbi:MAG TPA: serine hydrolase [Solirubrobacteraceae bacterium]|nr:serine hydrolase [Solirubrobacteraceae bacterium]